MPSSVASPTLELAEAIQAAKREGRRVLSLSTPSFPHRNLQIQQQQISAAMAPSEGDVECRHLLATALFERWRASQSEIVLTSGAKAALLCLIATLTTQRSKVFCFAPAWPTYFALADVLGRAVVVLERELAREWSIDHPDLGKLSKDDLVFLSNPCNPTGRVYSEEEIGDLAALTEKHGAWLVLDESFSHSADADTGFSAPVRRLGDRVVVVNSVSKNYSAQGWRLGAVFAAPSVLKTFAQVQTALLSPPASPLQSLLPTILEQPLDQGALGKRRSEMYDHVRSLGFDCTPSRGSFYLFPRRRGLSRAAADLRARLGIYLLDGSVFALRDHDFFRLCVLQSEEDYQAILRSLSEL